MDCAVIAQPYNHVSNIRRKNIWYSIGSGNWTNPNIWMSNALTPSTNIANQYPGQGSATYVYPRVGDDVYIGFGHTVTCNTTTTLNNLYVAGNLIFDTTVRGLTIVGDIQATGTVNMSNAAHNLTLYGVNNYIVNFNSGTTANVYYWRFGNQPVMSLTYRNLFIQSSGTKTALGDINVLNQLWIDSGTQVLGNNNFELSIYNLTVSGQTIVTGGGQLKKSGAGSVLFIGKLNLFPNAGAPASGLDFSVGNPTVELRGSINTSYTGAFKTGTGTWTFSTSNQTITGYGWLWDAPIIVAGAITVNMSQSSGTSAMQIGGSLNGTVAGSTFTNAGMLYFNNSTLPMTTGVFDYLSDTRSIVGYNFTGSYTLPYTSYQGLDVPVSGVKTLGGDTTVSQGLRIFGSGTLESSSYNLTVSGQTSNNVSGVGILSKNGAGTIVCIGLLNTGGSTGSLVTIGASGTLEVRGGVQYNTNQTTPINGSGTVLFSTNNQSIIFNGYTGAQATIPNPIMISGAITVTVSGANAQMLITNTLNGNNAASTIDNRVSIQYQNAQQPMLTGVLQTNAAANTFMYNKAGDQNITGGTYQTLTLAGSGVKTLQGNVVVATAYTLTPPATLNTNGFTRT